VGRWPRRLLASALGLAAGLGAAEVGLRIAGAVELARFRARVLESADGRPVVAFVGDSNVYGLYIDDEKETLPKQVERRTGRQVQCVNFAVPAAPTWAAVEQCRRALLLKPAAVVARAGINNAWQVPPGEGLGLLEGSRLVKWIRLWDWNRRAAPAQATAVGVEAHVTDQQSLLTTPPRDVSAAPLEILRAPRNLPFRMIEGRMRADFLEMARLCQAAGARLVLCTYLEAQDAMFESIRDLIASLPAPSPIATADCGALLTRALRAPAPGAASKPAAEPPLELTLARRALLLTRDSHPTALGYEIEAAVVVQALASAGVVTGDSADPLAPFLAAKCETPILTPVKGSTSKFRVKAEPGDRVFLVLGVEGTTPFRGQRLPLDAKALERQCGVRIPAAPMAKAGPHGFALLEALPTARPLPPRVLAVAYVERGGEFGAARVLMTPVVELAPAGASASK
jgi:hypothetical protein